MRTLKQACADLGVTYRTLEKWMKRLEITPDRHPRDYRHRVLEDDQVEQIRVARSEMPAHMPAVRPTASPARPAPVKRPVRPASSESRPSASQGAVLDLPAEYVTVEAFAQAHGVSRATVMQDVAGRWRRGVWKPGKNETGAIIGGPWHVDRNNEVRYALDADGRRRFVERFGHLAGFHTCEDCPHT